MSPGRVPGTGCHLSGHQRTPTSSVLACYPNGQTHVPLHPGLVVGFVEGERASSGGIWQIDDVHATGGPVTVSGQRGAAGDHLCHVMVHERPMFFEQLGTNGWDLLGKEAACRAYMCRSLHSATSAPVS